MHGFGRAGSSGRELEWAARAIACVLCFCGLSACGEAVVEDTRPGSDTDGVTVEYVAHAAVVVEAADGTRVLIDPYNGSKWMGYHFPGDLVVDAALVTHPHYDHDAVWELGAEVPIFTEPGTSDIGPVRVIGVEGEHSGAQRFRDRGVQPHNVIWVVDVGGVRLAHAGDNGLPTDRVLDEVGRVDILFTHPFFPVDTVAEAWARTGVRVIVPVHTRLPELAVESFRLPTADTWLRGKRPIRDVGNRARYTRAALSDRMEYHVFMPSTDVVAWDDQMQRAWELHGQAGAGDLSADSVLSLRETAAQLGPQVMTLQVAWAEALAEQGRAAEAEEVLVRALAQDEEGDVEQTLRAHALLADLLVRRGEAALAEEHLTRLEEAGRSYVPLPIR